MNQLFKKALFYMGIVLIQRGLGLVLYLAGSQWRIDARASIYFPFYIFSTLLSLIFMFYINKGTLAGRAKQGKGTPLWDKVILTVFWLLAYYAVYFAAGRESHPSLPLNAAFWLGMGLYVLSLGLSLWALAVNTFLEPTARIQKDRNQSVCQTGPYKIVRHPTYSALIIWAAGLILIFPKPYTCLCLLLISTLLCLRTYLEDKMLIAGLEGYKEYTKSTPFRLIPFVW